MKTTIQRLASVAGLTLFGVAVSSATVIINPSTPPPALTPQMSASQETFTLTNSAPNPPGYIQLAPGGTNSVPLNWNFYSNPDWALVIAPTSVQFDLTLAVGSPSSTSSFTLYLQDTLQNLIGPRTLVTSGTPGPNNRYTFTFLTSDPTILSALTSDGVLSTILVRDPGPGQNGGNTNSFLYVNSGITVTADVVPEPSTYLMMGSGLAAAALFLRRKRRA